MRKHFRVLSALLCLVACLISPPISAETQSHDQPADNLTTQEINAAEYSGGPLPQEVSALTLRLQILLDQAGMSPGAIDGVNGKNLSKAISAFEELSGQHIDGILDENVWKRLSSTKPVLIEYEITSEDVAGPFLKEVPIDFSEMAKLDRLSFTSVLEMFGERFHMDTNLLKAINPDADFNRAGTRIYAANVREHSATTRIASLMADKQKAQLKGYDKSGKLIVAYPATIGSDELPSPSGKHLIKAIATDAAYYYDPELNFQQGDNAEKLTIPPGPNNPIGTTWIDLSEPTYGIHGTPEPSEIDKTRSHGCIRLTNWDVEELATLVEKGVPVEFR